MSRLSFNSYPSRLTPSPTKISNSSFGRNQGNKSNDFPYIYPPWLVQRNDFQEIFKEYESLDKLDVYAIFQKEISQRKDSELNAIQLFIQSCCFFSNIFNANSLVKKFKPVTFEDGEEICNQESKNVSIIIKGKALLDNEVLVCKLTPIGEFQITEKKHLSARAVGRINAITVNEEEYRAIFMYSRLKQSQQIVGIMKQSMWFQDIKTVRLEKVASLAVSLQYEKDEELYVIGAKADWLFIIIHGKVELSSEIKLMTSNDLPTGLKKREKLIIEENFYTPVTSMGEHEVFGLYETVTYGERKTIAKTSMNTFLYAIKWSEMLEVITEQEKKKIVEKMTEAFNGHSLTKMLKNKRYTHKKHISALMEASDLKLSPRGRETFEEIPRRKRAYARLLFDKQEKALKENLVSKSYSFRSVILPRLGRFHEIK